MKTSYLLAIAVLTGYSLVSNAQTTNQSQVVSNGGGTSGTVSLSNFSVVGEPFVYSHTAGGSYESRDGFIYRISEPTQLSITLFLEGLFNGSGLNKARNTAGEQFPGLVADQITLELHNAQNYLSIPFLVHEVDLSTSGQAAITIPDVNSGYFYLTVKHRNSIETVSAQPLTFQGGAKTYDFTTGNDMAYGNNLKNISGHFCIFTGDINNDGLIDANDRNSIATAASIFASGYITNDLNGDGIVDALDLIMVDNNTAQFVSVLKP